MRISRRVLLPSGWMARSNNPVETTLYYARDAYRSRLINSDVSVVGTCDFSTYPFRLRTNNTQNAKYYGVTISYGFFFLKKKDVHWTEVTAENLFSLAAGTHTIVSRYLGHYLDK